MITFMMKDVKIEPAITGEKWIVVLPVPFHDDDPQSCLLAECDSKEEAESVQKHLQCISDGGRTIVSKVVKTPPLDTDKTH